MGELKGWRAELDKIWKQFVAQCESIEDGAPGSPSDISLDGMSDREKIRVEGFIAGLKHATKSIRRSVDSPKYNKADFPLFHRKPLSEEFDALAIDCRDAASAYIHNSPTAKQLEEKARLWEKAAAMAREAGD